MSRNSGIKNGIKVLYEQLKEMSAGETRRLYDLAYSAIHRAYLEHVIMEHPLTMEESELYATLSSSVALAVIVKDMAKARLKGLGEWKR